MVNSLLVKVDKKALNKALKALSVGFKSHKRYTEVYSIALCIKTPGKMSLVVLGGEYIIDAETVGNGCFALNYKWFKMFVKDCKTNNIEFTVNTDLLTINNSVSVKVKQCSKDIDIPLSLSYSVGELIRMDLTKVSEEVLDFWRLNAQIEDANKEIAQAIEKAYIQIAQYLPPQSSSNDFKSMLKKCILTKYER